MKISIIFYSSDKDLSDSILDLDIEPHKMWQILNIITSMRFPSLENFTKIWSKS